MSQQGPTAYYEDSLRQGRFVIQRCTACRKHVFYPRVLCPHCGSDQLEWVQPSGLGEVHAVTVVERSAAKGGPYNVVLVDLEEGVRLMSRVDGVDAQAVAIGMRVRTHLAPIEGGHQLVFRLQEEARP